MQIVTRFRDLKFIKRHFNFSCFDGKVPSEFYFFLLHFGAVDKRQFCFNAIYWRMQDFKGKCDYLIGIYSRRRKFFNFDCWALLSCYCNGSEMECSRKSLIEKASLHLQCKSFKNFVKAKKVFLLLASLIKISSKCRNNLNIKNAHFDTFS